VAPFPGMDARLALTPLGRTQTLDAYDKGAVQGFVDRYAVR